MTGAATTPAAAEALVEEARADLSETLDRLKDNLHPAHLVQEVVARPRAGLAHWIAVYGRFARQSPVSGLIIGAAALALSSAIVGRNARHRPAGSLLARKRAFPT